MIIAAFKNGETKVYTKSAHQFDKGQKLLVTGIALPDSYEIHMSNQKDSGMAYSCIGKIDGVTIPDALFVSGEYIYVWLYATSVEHEDTDAYGYSLGPDESLTEVPIEGKTIEEGTTIYEIVIPIIKRSNNLPVNYGSKHSYGYIVDEDETLVMVTQ